MDHGRFQSQQNHCLRMHIPTIKAQLFFGTQDSDP